MFKKSFFFKLLIIYTSVLVFILVLISSILQYSFQQLYYADEFRRLENSALEISDIFLQHNQGELSVLEFQIGVRTFSRSTNALVLIADNEGRILFNSSQLMGGTFQPTDRTLSDSYMPQLSKAVKGSTVRQVSTIEETGEAALNLIIPLADETGIYGGVIVSQPVQDITFIVQRINRLIWLVGFVGSILAVIIHSIVSKKFTDPISHLNNAALSMASGNFNKVDVKSKDEIGQLAKSFNYMGEQLAKQEENRREFLSTVSHELRTPLTSTLGFIQGMLDGVIDSHEQEHYLNLTVKEIKRVISLTNDLLHLERIKQGQIELQQDCFDLVFLLKECKEQLTPLAKEKNIAIYLEAPEDLIVIGDRNRLKQAFVNLLDNGIRHSKSRISINVSVSNRYVEIVMSDDGPGISQEDMPYIFERFYKADKSRTSKGSGSGLGLSIAKHLIELHDGDIQVLSSEQGATFKITLIR